ncbi:MAG: hypothetical protein WD275_09025 [Rhodothermales bacterium]
MHIWSVYRRACRPVYTIIAPLILAVVLVGCASSQKMFEKAREFEGRGDYLRASHEYIEVLERESEWPEARMRLNLVGPLAVDTLLARARGAEAASNFPKAVDHLDALDELRTASANVGVPLPAPDDYAAYRNAMVDQAIAFYLDAGYQAEMAGGWKDGLAAYDRALTYGMPAARRDEIKLKKAHVHFWWAEDEAKEGRYRGAYAQAEHGLSLGAQHADLSDRLSKLQNDALSRGTRLVALLPLMASPEWDRDAPADLLSDVDAALNYEYWSSPPLFIETIDQGEIRRRMRDMGYARRDIDPKDAARIGRGLESDFVIAGDLRRYREKEDERKKETKRVKLRGTKADTTYTLRTIRVRIEAGGRFFMTDPNSGRIVTEFDVSATEDAEYNRASYAGAVSTLDLSRREEDYFGSDLRANAIHEAHDRLLEKLAEQIASRSYDAALNQIP